MKIIILILTFCSQLHATEIFTFHEECNNNLCESATNSIGQVELYRRTPVLILQNSDIESVAIGKDPYGFEELHLALKHDASKKLEKISEEFINKSLYIVSDKKIIMNPHIATKIAGGRFAISSPLMDIKKFVNENPELKKILEAKKSQEGQKGLIEILLYALVMLTVVGGSVYFAFFKN